MEPLLLETGKSSTHPEKAPVRTKRDLCTMCQVNLQGAEALSSGEWGGDGLGLGCKQKSQDGGSYRRKALSSCLGQTGVV